MKKLTVLGIFTLFLVSMLAISLNAQEVEAGQICISYPVWGKVDFFGETISGHEVTISAISIRGDVQRVWKTSTNEHGEYVDDLANQLPSCWYRTEFVRLQACDDLAGCTVEVDITESSKVRQDFIFRESSGKDRVIKVGNDIIIEKEKPIYVCPDGSKVVDAQLCPKEEEKEAEDDAVGGGNPIIVAAVTIVVLGLTALWNYYKQTEVRGKYRWMPGMAGILRRILRQYQEASREGDVELAKKKSKTLLKYSTTITKKYLSQLGKK